MKNIIRSFFVIAILFAATGTMKAQSANSKKAEFKVYGNCGMCEARIEKAAKSLDGVSEADWNKDTKMIEVTYDPDQVKLMDIHKAIADVGHDTDKAEAENSVYSDLPMCCKYDRKKK